MKIDRKQLRQAVTDALAEHKARHDQAIQRWESAVELDRKAWIDDHLPAWGETAKVIARKVRKGEPIVREDLPRERHGSSPLLYRQDDYSLRLPSGEQVRRPDRAYTAPYELSALGKALDVITDDEITHTALRSLGITGATLRDAIAQLGRNSAAVTS